MLFVVIKSPKLFRRAGLSGLFVYAGIKGFELSENVYLVCAPFPAFFLVTILIVLIPQALVEATKRPGK
jgi:hypothetical protein